MQFKSSIFFKGICFLLCFLLFWEQSGFAQSVPAADVSARLAATGSVRPQDVFRPLHVRSLSHDGASDNFTLLLDGDDLATLRNEEVETSSRRLMEFFWVGMRLPNDAFWVNLRPDASDQIIDDDVARTDVGRILLEADLQLKKDTASATSPQNPAGRLYWEKLYKKAQELYGSSSVTIPTLTRPWIVPGEIVIRDSGSSAYIYKATLKVMLEEDYLKRKGALEASALGQTAGPAFDDARAKELNVYATELLRQLVIPELTRQVNSARRYAPLRQVYYSLIFAQWFKQKCIEEGRTRSARVDTRDLSGLTSATPWSKERYFQEYQKSFQQGEYNLKENRAAGTGYVVRTYTSGGIGLTADSMALAIQAGGAIVAREALPEALTSRYPAVRISSEGSVTSVTGPSSELVQQADAARSDTPPAHAVESDAAEDAVRLQRKRNDAALRLPWQERLLNPLAKLLGQGVSDGQIIVLYRAVARDSDQHGYLYSTHPGYAYAESAGHGASAVVTALVSRGDLGRLFAEQAANVEGEQQFQSQVCLHFRTEAPLASERPLKAEEFENEVVLSAGARSSYDPASLEYARHTRMLLASRQRLPAASDTRDTVPAAAQGRSSSSALTDTFMDRAGRDETTDNLYALHHGLAGAIEEQVSDEKEKERYVLTMREEDRFIAFMEQEYARLRALGMEDKEAKERSFALAAQTIYYDMFPDGYGFVPEGQEFSDTAPVSIRAIPAVHDAYSKLERGIATGLPLLFVKSELADDSVEMAVEGYARQHDAQVVWINAHPYCEMMQLLGTYLPRQSQWERARQIVEGASPGELRQAIARLLPAEMKVTDEVLDDYVQEFAAVKEYQKGLVTAVARELDEDFRRQEEIPFEKGILPKVIEAAQDPANRSKKILLVLDNVEALKPRVRALLNHVLLFREIEVTDLNVKYSIPSNVHIVATMHRNAELRDTAFYDRFLRKDIRDLSDAELIASRGLSGQAAAMVEALWKSFAGQQFLVKGQEVRFSRKELRDFLSLLVGAYQDECRSKGAFATEAHPELWQAVFMREAAFFFFSRLGITQQDIFRPDGEIGRLVSLVRGATGALPDPEPAIEFSPATSTVRIYGVELPVIDGIRDAVSLYRKTGLVLTRSTLQMLGSMAREYRYGGRVIVVVGSTGIGKTYTAGGFARLLGKRFYNEPVHKDFALERWNGEFAQDEYGQYFLDDQTPMYLVLTEGGVAAVSELNTKVDADFKAQLGWWFIPAARGDRSMGLYEYPRNTADGSIPQLVFGSGTRKPLVVIDINPLSYTQRGQLQELLSYYATGLSVIDDINDDDVRQILSMYLLDMEDTPQKAECMKTLGSFHVWLHAYLKEHGAKEYNYILTYRELNRVTQYLMRHGAGALSEAIDLYYLKRMPEALRQHVKDQFGFSEVLGDGEAIRASWVGENNPTLVSVSQNTDVWSYINAALATAGIPDASDGDRVRVLPVTAHTGYYHLVGGYGLKESAAISDADALKVIDRYWDINKDRVVAMIRQIGHLEGVFSSAGQIRLQLSDDQIRALAVALRSLEHYKSWDSDLEWKDGFLVRTMKESASDGKDRYVVLENYYRIQPAIAVMLNELLQDGTLSLPHGPALRLTEKTHILATVNQDAQLPLSPAELSRWVIVQCRAPSAGQIHQRLIQLVDSLFDPGNTSPEDKAGIVRAISEADKNARALPQASQRGYEFNLSDMEHMASTIASLRAAMSLAEAVRKAALLVYEVPLALSSETGLVTQDDFRAAIASASRHPDGVVQQNDLDLLVELPQVRDIQTAIINDMQQGRRISILMGPPGAGKTELGVDIALRVGLDSFVFSSHGQVELDEFIGGVSRDARGNYILTALPDAEGNFSNPFLQLLTHGGIYVVDEGPIGKKAQELIAWLSPLARGQGKVYIQEHPVSTRGSDRAVLAPLSVHPDFHIVITMNPPGETVGRETVPSEIWRRSGRYWVNEELNPAHINLILERWYRLLGSDIPVSVRDQIIAFQTQFYLRVKEMTGKIVGKGNADLHHMTLRNLRHSVRETVRMYREEGGSEGFYHGVALGVLASFLRQFGYGQERALLTTTLNTVLEETVSDQTAKAKIWYYLNQEPLEDPESQALSGMEQAMASHQPLLLIYENGAPAVKYMERVARKNGAELFIIDCNPDMDVYDILGGVTPVIGSRDYTLQPGELTRHLSSGQTAEARPRIILFANIDLLDEKVRVVLNNFLINGFIEMESSENGSRRLVLPSTVQLAATIWDGSKSKFSSAFTNRFPNKVVVSAYSEEKLTDVIEREMRLSGEEAALIAQVHGLVMDIERQDGWRRIGGYHFTAEDAIHLARYLALAKREYDRTQLKEKQLTQLAGQDRDQWRQVVKRLLGDEVIRRYRNALDDSSDGSQSDRRVFDEQVFAPVFGTSAALDRSCRFDPSGMPVSFAGVSVNAKMVPSQVPEKFRLYYGQTITGYISSLLRAIEGISLPSGDPSFASRLIFMMGKSGVSKTTLAAHLSYLLGMGEPYIYSTHAGSRVADLTREELLNRDGIFEERIKNFLQFVERGNTVLIIDEGNIRPEILAVVQAIGRGERELTIPRKGKEPFRVKVGENVIVIVTMNPESFAGRRQVAGFLTGSAAKVWMEASLSEAEEKTILRSKFAVSRGLPIEEIAYSGASAEASAEQGEQASTFDRDEASEQEVDASRAPQGARRQQGRKWRRIMVTTALITTVGLLGGYFIDRYSSTPEQRSPVPISDKQKELVKSRAGKADAQHYPRIFRGSRSSGTSAQGPGGVGGPGGKSGGAAGAQFGSGQSDDFSDNSWSGVVGQADINDAHERILYRVSPDRGSVFYPSNHEIYTGIGPHGTLMPPESPLEETVVSPGGGQEELVVSPNIGSGQTSIPLISLDGLGKLSSSDLDPGDIGAIYQNGRGGDALLQLRRSPLQSTVTYLMRSEGAGSRVELSPEARGEYLAIPEDEDIVDLLEYNNVDVRSYQGADYKTKVQFIKSILRKRITYTFERKWQDYWEKSRTRYPFLVLAFPGQDSYVGMQCSGIARTSVLLARHLGIPSYAVGGFFDLNGDGELSGDERHLTAQFYNDETGQWENFEGTNYTSVTGTRPSAWGNGGMGGRGVSEIKDWEDFVAAVKSMFKSLGMWGESPSILQMVVFFFAGLFGSILCLAVFANIFPRATAALLRFLDRTLFVLFDRLFTPSRVERRKLESLQQALFSQETGSDDFEHLRNTVKVFQAARRMSNVGDMFQEERKEFNREVNNLFVAREKLSAESVDAYRHRLFDVVRDVYHHVQKKRLSWRMMFPWYRHSLGSLLDQTQDMYFAVLFFDADYGRDYNRSVSPGLFEEIIENDVRDVASLGSVLARQPLPLTDRMIIDSLYFNSRRQARWEMRYSFVAQVELYAAASGFPGAFHGLDTHNGRLIEFLRTRYLSIPWANPGEYFRTCAQNAQEFAEALPLLSRFAEAENDPRLKREWAMYVADFVRGQGSELFTRTDVVNTVFQFVAMAPDVDWQDFLRASLASSLRDNEYQAVRALLASGRKYASLAEVGYPHADTMVLSARPLRVLIVLWQLLNSPEEKAQIMEAILDKTSMDNIRQAVHFFVSCGIDDESLGRLEGRIVGWLDMIARGQVDISAGRDFLVNIAALHSGAVAQRLEELLRDGQLYRHSLAEVKGKNEVAQSRLRYYLLYAYRRVNGSLSIPEDILRRFADCEGESIKSPLDSFPYHTIVENEIVATFAQIRVLNGEGYPAYEFWQDLARFGGDRDSFIAEMLSNSRMAVHYKDALVDLLCTPARYDPAHRYGFQRWADILTHPRLALLFSADDLREIAQALMARYHEIGDDLYRRKFLVQAMGVLPEAVKKEQIIPVLLDIQERQEREGVCLTPLHKTAQEVILESLATVSPLDGLQALHRSATQKIRALEQEFQVTLREPRDEERRLGKQGKLDVAEYLRQQGKGVRDGNVFVRDEPVYNQRRMVLGLSADISNSMAAYQSAVRNFKGYFIDKLHGESVEHGVFDIGDEYVALKPFQGALSGSERAALQETIALVSRESGRGVDLCATVEAIIRKYEQFNGNARKVELVVTDAQDIAGAFQLKSGRVVVSGRLRKLLDEAAALKIDIVWVGINSTLVQGLGTYWTIRADNDQLLEYQLEEVLWKAGTIALEESRLPLGDLQKLARSRWRDTVAASSSLADPSVTEATESLFVMPEENPVLPEASAPVAAPVPAQDTIAAAAVSDKGGIDFRVLPIVSQAAAHLREQLDPGAVAALRSLDLESESREIRRMSAAGIRLSPERIKEYLQAACIQGKAAGELVGVMAGILRSQESCCEPTDPFMRDVLIVVESLNADALQKTLLSSGP